MNEAIFFRKSTSFNDLKWRTEVIPDLGQKLNYEIVETIILDKKKYNDFLNGFMWYFDFIDKLKDKLFIDENDCVHCLLVKSKNDPGILVYPSGYSYARYVAINS